jgi:phosphate transport system permease protein
VSASTGLLADAARRRAGRRRTTNRIMLGTAGAAAIIAVVPLVWIVAYVVVQGISAISLEFFTNLPTPVGVPGGGIANSIVGSLITVGLGVIIAMPIGLLIGFYAAARSQSRSGKAIRFLTDTVAGVPSIVMGIFAYTIIVLPQGHFSALSGRPRRCSSSFPARFGRARSPWVRRSGGHRCGSCCRQRRAGS